MRTFESEIEYLLFLRDEVIPYSRTQKYHSPGNQWREELRIKKFSKLRKDIIYWRTGLGWQLRREAEKEVIRKLIANNPEGCPLCGSNTFKGENFCYNCKNHY